MYVECSHLGLVTREEDSPISHALVFEATLSTLENAIHVCLGIICLIEYLGI